MYAHLYEFQQAPISWSFPNTGTNRDMEKDFSVHLRTERNFARRQGLESWFQNQNQKERKIHKKNLTTPNQRAKTSTSAL
jgi:hypothetical protein